MAAALAGSEAVYGSPAPPEAGPAGQMVRGTELAIAEVRDTTAVLLWPARLTWVGPETITSLIEAHGTDRATMLRPAWHGDPGWPVLLPTAHLETLRAVPPDHMPPMVIEDLAGTIATRVVEMGDPGVIHDVDTAPEDLPPTRGRPTRRPVTPTNGAPTSPRRPDSPSPDRPGRQSASGLGRARCHRSRSRATGTVAPAIPPMTRPTPRSWVTDGVSRSSTIARPIDITGWSAG